MPKKYRKMMKGSGPDWDPYFEAMTSTSRVFGARYECMMPFGLIDYVTKREAYDFGINWDGLIVEHGGPPDGTPRAHFHNEGYEEQWFFTLPKKELWDGLPTPQEAAAMPFVERTQLPVEDGVYVVARHANERHASLDIARHTPFKQDLRNRGVRKSSELSEPEEEGA
ncbi:uncharacterized protein B0H18DRAFT_1126244 [Fomitopsis serialis]|uniref:uncharacterized protein n=1 Tax=Fomitopsis serialis TaxID=139415 RepID=UPI002008D9FD|nr:uncharacterized protein B0H18DRAFT_1126244 [Neoantrodia serialis]KAH9913432.1 hypothetical protein B0H18DRAFT_1126244 [Neoantrodia serialis]